MIRKYRSPLSGHVRVVFELPSCIWADKVSITGDFNDWNQSSTPMLQDRNGVWSAMVDLPKGNRYEFRYLIDGQWRTDFHSDGHTDNVYGTQNSIIVAELPEPNQSTHRQKSSLVREHQAKSASHRRPNKRQNMKQHLQAA